MTAFAAAAAAVAVGAVLDQIAAAGLVFGAVAAAVEDLFAADPGAALEAFAASAAAVEVVVKAAVHHCCPVLTCSPAGAVHRFVQQRWSCFQADPGLVCQALAEDQSAL